MTTTTLRTIKLTDKDVLGLPVNIVNLTFAANATELLANHDFTNALTLPVVVETFMLDKDMNTLTITMDKDGEFNFRFVNKSESRKFSFLVTAKQYAAFLRKFSPTLRQLIAA